MTGAQSLNPPLSLAQLRKAALRPGAVEHQRDPGAIGLIINERPRGYRLVARECGPALHKKRTENYFSLLKRVFLSRSLLV